MNFSSNLNIQLIDDKSIKNSIVFDFPSNGENEFRSVILINQSLLKNLALRNHFYFLNIISLLILFLICNFYLQNELCIS